MSGPFFIGASGASALATSVPIPDATDPLVPLEVGDVLILGGHGDVSFTCTDARMTKIADANPDPHPGQSSVWWGIYDGNNDPITYTSDGGEFDRDGARVSAWRAKPLSGFVQAGPTLAASATQPTIDGASRVVGVSFLGNSVVDGTLSLTGYTEHSYGGTPIGKMEILFHAWAGPRGTSPSGLVTADGSDPRWTVTLLRLNPLSTAAPPCRNIKRGDRLDLGGARNYPPSKMQQTSSRGVGAY